MPSPALSARTGFLFGVMHLSVRPGVAGAAIERRLVTDFGSRSERLG